MGNLMIWTIDEFCNCIFEIRIQPNVRGVFSAKLFRLMRLYLRIRLIHTSKATPVNPFASAAAFATDRPPATLPVKETKLTEGLPIAWLVNSGDIWTTWRTFSGRPVCLNARAKRSAVKGVWGEGLRRTAFPARMAGRTELTTVRYG